MSTARPALSLYLHFPWCIKKCPYCDFNSHTAPTNLPEKPYVDRLISEFEQTKPLWLHRPIHSIFIGGGTPSLISPTALSPLFDYLRQNALLTDATEVTLEANPGATDTARFIGYRQLGINRLSIGVQSFNDQALVRLGRVHNQADAVAAFDLARSAGFDNINLDLMFALPEQDIDAALSDLKKAIELKPEHLSWYQLTLEPNTLFHRFPPVVPDHDTASLMQENGLIKLSLAGYRQYEVSAFAQPARQCQHNRQYWTFGDYLGLGAGAHSKLADAQYPNRIHRHWNKKNPKDYLNPKQDPKQGSSIVHGHRLLFEFFLNRFRLLTPVTEAELVLHTAMTFAAIRPTLDQAVAKQLLRVEKSTLLVTPLGRRFLNDLLELWLTAD